MDSIRSRRGSCVSVMEGMQLPTVQVIGFVLFFFSSFWLRFYDLCLSICFGCLMLVWGLLVPGMCLRIWVDVEIKIRSGVG